MIRIILISSLLFSSFGSNSQNLVIDGSLEDTLKCPQSIGRFYHPTNVNERYTAQWRATTLASPDYHNTCGYSTYQARTGEGYAAILYYDPSEYREYISALLTAPLVAGECYYLEYYVALSANSTLAIDELQVHFSNAVPLDMTFPPPGPLALTPHLEASAAPTLTTYQKINGFYTAIGGETVITFGNFYDNANTNTTVVSASGSVNSYYYIDDVTLTQLDIGPDVNICAGDSSLIIPNIICPSLTYSWSNGSADTVTYVQNAGPLWLDLSGNGSCSLQDTLIVSFQSIDISVLETGTSLTSNQNGASYQWLDCNNSNNAIPGATGQTYNPPSSGDFAVEINMNGCIDTSICYAVNILEIDEINSADKKIVKIVDLLGRETQFVPNTVLIYVYSDGSIERMFKVE